MFFAARDHQPNSSHSLPLTSCGTATQNRLYDNLTCNDSGS